MTNQEIIQKGFSDTVGAVLDMLVENDASRTLKTAVRAEIYKLCDSTVQPMVIDLEKQ